MAKAKSRYQCTQCGAVTSKWSGQCGSCQGWNCLEVMAAEDSRRGYAGTVASLTTLSEVEVTKIQRSPSGLSELDRVLGGGLVPGAVVLIGGDPGIGKSTILLQALAGLSEQGTALYVTGEESLQQVALRAQRMGVEAAAMQLLTETQVESIVRTAQQAQPSVMVVDSIQTMFSDQVPSAPGAVAQVRECAAQLVRFAKQSEVTLFLVGHVTKEGALAGPRVLEHMVDTVLYFEGRQDSRYRVIRAVKNRFGAVNELGVFAMTEKGLRTVSNPSAIFLSREGGDVPGSVVLVTWEGSRPLLVELQALVDPCHGGQARRLSVGLDQNRLVMLLAVLHRHGGIESYDQDVFINIVGGVRVTETGVDLALLLAIVSSLRNRAIAKDWVAFGEVGLAGEIRPVQSGAERLKEAAKHGFSHAIVPQSNAPKTPIEGLTVIPVARLEQALAALR